MAADVYHLDLIRSRARSGFYDEAELVAMIADIVDDEYPDAPEVADELAATAREELAALAAAELTWTEPTMNDRISAAFVDLDALGIIALENAGYTTSEGWDAVNELATDRDAAGERPRGATFYHGQDLERGVAGEGLMLIYGAYVEGDGHVAASLEVARDVVATLLRFGVPASWNGDIKTRIEIASFPWQQRLTTANPLLG
jgi:hypothetical protein